MFYFFHGSALAVVTHGFAKKQSAVPDQEIDYAISCRDRFQADPQRHTHEE
jgi:hypothetical protein